MEPIEFPGPILFLSSDPATVEAQLAGAVLTLAEAGLLRDDVSTDEITPMTALTYYDERLARHPYTGFSTGGRTPIGVDAVRSRGVLRDRRRQAVRQRIVA